MIDRAILGYIIYRREDDSYHEVERGTEEIEDEYQSHKAEEMAIIQGLSVAREHYSEGTVTILTDHQSTVERLRDKCKLSGDKELNRGLSILKKEFDEIAIKWIPSDENTAHWVCESAKETE